MTETFMHPRETIRETFVALIKAAKTVAGDNVFNMRDFNLFIETMPAINISTQSETIEDGHDFGLRRRVLTVDIECYAACENGARFVNQLAWEVEEIFHANPNLNNTVETCRLQNIAFAFGDNGALALHGAILTFEVTYVTNIPSPHEGNATTGIVEHLVGFKPETGMGNNGTIYQLLPFQLLSLTEYISEKVKLRAILKGTEKLSPVLFAPIQLIAGKIHKTATYVTRAFTFGEKARLTSYIKTFLLGGATFSLEMQQDNGAFVPLKLDEIEQLSEPLWTERKFVSDNKTAKQARLKLTLTGGLAARSMVRDFGAGIL